jgi:hypothetical protein
MIRKVVLRAFAFLLCTGSLAAQARVIKVSVTAEDDKTSKDVTEILRGKIGSTLRYALSEPAPALLTVDVVCVSVGTINVACTAPTLYYPDAARGLSWSLPVSVAVGDPNYVAEALFNYFVASSSDDKLTEGEASLAFGTAKFYQEGYGNGFKAGVASVSKPPASTPPKKN